MVLIVDGDPRILEEAANILGAKNVWFAASADHARSLLTTVGHSFSVALIDRELPSDDAFKLIAELHEYCPEVVVMVMVSAADTSVNGHTNAGGIGLLRKPITRDWRDLIIQAQARRQR